MTEEEQVDAAVLIMQRFRELTLGNIAKDRQVKYLLFQLGGYVMPTQMNAIIDKLKEIEEEVANAELKTD
jgi:hypothetical protein